MTSPAAAQAKGPAHPDSEGGWWTGLRLALARADFGAYAWLGLWALLAAAILGAVAHVAIAGIDPLEGWLLERYLPERAWGAARWLIEHFAEAQVRTAVVTTTITGGMLLVSATLFVIKEKASARFELAGDPSLAQRWREPPLWRLALEEGWLVLLYAALSALSFWIGYGGERPRQLAAAGLTQLVMAFTLAVDYVAPAMQRHGWRYTQVVRQVLRRPVLVLGFGLFFGAPSVVALHLLEHPGPGELMPNIGVLVAVQLICLGAALWVGTYAGARISQQEHQPGSPGLPVSAHLATWGLIVFSALSLGGVGRSAYRALPLLKCEYALVPGSWSLGVGEGASVRLEFALQVHNPTAWPAELNEHRVEIVHEGDLLADARFDPFSLPGNTRATRHAAFELEGHAGLANKGLRAALDFKRKGWREAGAGLLAGAAKTEAYQVTMYLPTPVMDFPIYLVGGPTPH